MRESPVPHAPRREATRSYAARLTTPLTPRVALDLGMNFAPVCVEHAHGDGVGRPVEVSHNRNRAVNASSVGDQLALLHPLSAPLSQTRTGR
jgi:hypothetical protein